MTRRQMLTRTVGGLVALGTGGLAARDAGAAATAGEPETKVVPPPTNAAVGRGRIRAGSAWREVALPPTETEVSSTPVFNAVVFSAGDATAAVLSVDVIGLGADFASSVRGRVEAETKIPGDHIMVAATHNHMVPWMMEGEHQREAEDLSVELLVDAFRKQKPAAMVAGMHETPGYEFHRRLWGADGFIVMNWEAHERDLKPAGTVTTRMGFIGFEDAEGVPLGLILSYPCHNNCGGPGATRDIGGMMGDLFRGHYGKEIGVAFLEAPCGDINWCDSRTYHIKPWYSGSEAEPAELAFNYEGDRLAKEIAGAWWSRCRPVFQTARRVRRAGMVAHREVMQIEERPLQECDRVDPRRQLYLDDQKWLVENGTDRVWPVEVQTIAIGDAALASNPSEFFSRFGRDIMDRSPFATTLTVELANDRVGYIGTPEAIEQGGYEVMRKRRDKFAVDAGDRIVRQLVGMLEQSKRELEASG